jgi:hypothetical protein
MSANLMAHAPFISFFSYHFTYIFFQKVNVRCTPSIEQFNQLQFFVSLYLFNGNPTSYAYRL